MNLKTNDIAIIISCYRPSHDFINTLKYYRNKFEMIVVIDDGSDNNYNDILSSIELLDIKLIKNSSNLGLAKSLNLGINFINKINIKWALLLDQDSFLPEDEIIIMIEKFNCLPTNDKNKISIISPSYKDNNLKFKQKSPKIVITSGNIIPVEKYISKYKFSEKLFIDYLDVETCLKIHKNKDKILHVSEAVMKHSIGESVLKKFLFRNVIVTNHNYIRRYYITRNRVYLWKKYFIKNFFWFIKDFKGSLGEFIKILLWEKGKMKKIKMIFTGFFHGLFGKMGKIPERMVK